MSVEELRRLFDASFAELPDPREVQVEHWLGVGVDGLQAALRLDAISGLYADRVVTPVPTPLPELLGVVGLRGELVPVYSLAALLERGAVQGTPRWFVVARGVALAFDRFDGYTRVEHEQHAPSAGVGEIVQTAMGRRVVIDVPVVLEKIQARVRAASPEVRS